MELPEISVAVAAYNESRFIDRCLRSLANQTLEVGFEVVMVDDGSSDDTVSIAERFVELMRLRVFRNGENRGIGATAARAVAESHGRFIVRVDADDYVSRDFLHVLHLALTSRDAPPAVRCDYLLVDDREHVIARADSRLDPIACGVMMSRESMASVGLYKPELRLGEDVEFENRYTAKFDIGHVPIPLYRYRRHGSNSSGALE